MNSPKKRVTTYRLTLELDHIIAKEAEKLGVSKNALVQMTLIKALLSSNNNDQATPAKAVSQ
ncbi:MAG: hypothetical protein IMW93_06230 [Thermoanaerobacteraceae bacterium]|nr:hypothetical protein [Thermoanaerobacteraceae bacterium]